MRLDLLYLLTIFVLPSIAKTHHQSIFHEVMAFGDKGVIGTVIDTLESANRRAQDKANSASGTLGKKLFGATAESEEMTAEPIAPSASHEPTTVGRRSKRSDGIDPFHASVDADSSESGSKPDNSEPEAAEQV